jgi:iron complex transport system substrate-binding protein
VESDLGPVTIVDEPTRIVSLSATHTEMLYALGAASQVAATDLTSNFPTAALDTAKIDSFNFNIEEVAALRPDLVILAFDFQGEADALATIDIPFLLLGPPATLEGAFSQLLNLGAAVGRADAAVALVNGLSAEVDRIVAAGQPLKGLSFFHEVDDTLFTAASDSFIGDLYARLGLVNIADAAAADGPYFQLSAEFIVDQDPDFIFLADGNFGVTAASVAERPGWSTMRAVADGNVIELDGDAAGRWGPRTVDLLRSILDAAGGRLR